jgi:transposase-like protein
LLAEQGLHADHVTVWRWVQRYAPEIQRRLRPRLKATNVRSLWDAWRTIAGYEAIHMIRKGQARWSAKVGLLHRFILGLFAATN